jgi:hypothetical protein
VRHSRRASGCRSGVSSGSRGADRNRRGAISRPTTSGPPPARAARRPPRR